MYNDRYFNSLVTIKKGSILIQGSRIGSRQDLDKSGIHVHLGEGANAKTIDIRVFDWVASVQKWAVDAVNDLGSSIVRAVRCRVRPASSARSRRSPCRST